MIDCPKGPALGASSDPGRYLFYKVSCGAGQPTSLWAVDPAAPTAPRQVEAEMVDGSFQTITGGIWNTGTQKVDGKEAVMVVYAGKDGRFYRVSSLKSDPPGPVQISNERLTSNEIFKEKKKIVNEKDEEDLSKIFCSASALADYADPGNSIYLYELSGKDGSCGASDDNVQKMIRLGMGPAENPIALSIELPPAERNGTDRSLSKTVLFVEEHYDRVDLDRIVVDDIKPVQTVITFQDTYTSPALFPLIDLVDKNNGAIIGWLATRSRTQAIPPALEFTVNDRDDTFTTPYNHGLMSGTPVMVSGGALPAGLDPNTLYFVSVPRGETKTFKLFRSVKRVKRLFNLNSEMKDFKAVFTGSPPAEDEQQDFVDVTSDGSGTFHRIMSFTDLYRCDLNLANCHLLKQTEFLSFCQLDGANQWANPGQPLPKSFVVGVFDTFGAPVSGIPVTWGIKSDPETKNKKMGSITPMSVTGADGLASATGALGPDAASIEKVPFAVSIGFPIGSPLIFAPGSKPPSPGASTSPPFCKMAKDFDFVGTKRSFFSRISPQGYGNMFAGQMPIRFDLDFKPDPGNEDPVFANKEGTKGALYLYDIASSSFSSPRYTSSEKLSDGTAIAFPEGLPFVTDNAFFYFGDRGRLYRLRLDGTADAAFLVEEGTEFSQMKLTDNRVVCSLLDKSGPAPRVALKTIGKGGGGTATLLGFTEDSLLPVMTAGEESSFPVVSPGAYVYYQTMGASFDPPGVVSKIFVASEDGGLNKVIERAGFGGGHAQAGGGGDASPRFPALPDECRVSVITLQPVHGDLVEP